MAGTRKPVQRVVLNLPMPPSVNALSRAGKGCVYSSPKYKAWKEAAGWALNHQLPGQVKGPYKITIKLARNETKADIGNLEKAASDLLQSHGVIENDNLAQSVTLLWGAAEGCVVTVESFEPMAEAA